ncbi:hypothetical protein M2164_007004 [Streptomyces sp. SAI-208]|nr:hypothetical protein [Streptomyces sp. SAI-117]MDH6611369.1 hypothetical protein [Streptomyces sp. SAI-208]
MDDDSGARPGGEGLETDGTDARRARGDAARGPHDDAARGYEGQGTAGDGTQVPGKHTDQGTGGDETAHGAGRPERPDVRGYRPHATGTHADQDPAGDQPHSPADHQRPGRQEPRSPDHAGHHPRPADEPGPRNPAGHQGRSTSDPAARRRTPGHPARAGTSGPAHPHTAWEQHVEIPLAVASLAFLAAYALRVLAPGLPQAVLDLCLAVTLAAWALFAVDYAVRWRLSGQRLRFVRTHVLDTVVLLLPLLRPLRVVKVYETVLRRRGRPRLALHARVMAYSGLSTLLLGFAGALAVYQQERHAPGTTMPTFGDAVWWTCATLTTVGYGDVTPVTPLGRLIAVGVMMIGMALLAAVTGTFASWLLQVFSREDDERPPGS